MKKAFADGEISIKGLYDSTSEQRRAMFEKYIPAELAQATNAKFEEAMVSKQKTALQDWASSVFKPKELKTERHNTVLDKIKELDEMGVLGKDKDSFLNDLVAEKLGITVTPDELRVITEKAQKVDELFTDAKLYDKDGLINVESMVAKKDLNDYVNSLTPTHKLKIATSIIGRGNMLMNVPPAILNAVSNTVQGAMQVFEKRIARGILDIASGEKPTIKGTNIDFGKKYIARALKIYQETGYDVTRLEMSNKGDLIHFEEPGQQRLGEDIIHSEGPGLIRKYGRFTSKVVFKYLLGFNDALSATTQAMDTATLDSLRMAQREGLSGNKAQTRALEILKDSARLQPTTTMGQLVKSQSIVDARTATWTNKGHFNTISLAIRNVLNVASGDLSAGDTLMPFVTTAANVIEFSLDSAGMGFIKGTYGLIKGAKAEWEAGNPDPMQKVITQYVRAGLGMTLAYVLANMFDPDDFVSAYEATTIKGRDLAKMKNAPYNAIRIGDKWYSLDYFGALGSGFVGMMYARKYGDGLLGTVHQYIRGAGGQVLQIPGFRDLPDIYDKVSSFVQQKDIEKPTKGLPDAAVNFIRSRTVPAILNNLLQGTDEYIRDTSQKYSRTKAATPGLRETVPPKINQTTGEPIKSEGFFSNLLFGSRVKTVAENELTKEITRLETEGLAPAISDIQQIPSIKELRTQIGEDKFQEALQFYGETYGKIATAVIDNPKYQNTDIDELKKDILNSVRSDAVKIVLQKYYYRPKRKYQKE